MRSDGCYGECLVARKPTIGGAIAKAALIGLVIVLALLGYMISPVLFVVNAILIFFTVMIWPRFDVVYEYVFVDGQLDFDKILGGNGRKHAKRIDMDKVEIVAPVNSHALDGYQHMSMKPQDFTSLIRDEEHKVYAIIHKGDKEMEYLLFEPDAALLALMKSKAPRKVVEI